MSLKTLKEYRALTKDSTELVICAEKLSDAALALESDTVELNQVTILRGSVQVEVPDSVVRFNVTVTPEEAGTAGCVALPTTFLVDPGTEVILQAVPSAGYNFVGWYRDTTLLSNEAIASIAVVAPAAGATADEILATFELAT